MKKIRFVAFFLLLSCSGFAQYGTGDVTTAADFQRIPVAPERASRDLVNLPASYSLKPYAPVPGNQGIYGTCSAWSSAYGARTISYALQRNMKNKDSIARIAFSPAFLYQEIKSPGDYGCSAGASILKAMEVMNKTGVTLKGNGDFVCSSNIPSADEAGKAVPYKIKDFQSLTPVYGSITKNDIINIKKSISENKPVVISIKCYGSLSYVPASGIWARTYNASDTLRGYHAVCIVGYDDSVGSGSFEVMNSWGTTWGNHGFFWLSYAQLTEMGDYAVTMMDYEYSQPVISGNMEFIQTDGTPMPVTRTKINTRSITIEDDDKANYSMYHFPDNYPGGTEFKIRFSTNAPSYIYILGDDDKGVVSRLFPYDTNISAAVNSSNATYYLPSETKHAKLSYSPGKENICVLYSKSEIDFEGLLKYINDTKTPVSQAVMDKLGPRVMDLKKIDFSNSAIQFDAPAADNSVICFFIQLDHH